MAKMRLLTVVALGLVISVGLWLLGGLPGQHRIPAARRLNYLQALYAAGVHGYFDAVAWHPYNYWRGATASDMLAYNHCSAWSRMASTPVSVCSLIDSHGDGVADGVLGTYEECDTDSRVAGYDWSVMADRIQEVYIRQVSVA